MVNLNLIRSFIALSWLTLLLIITLMCTPLLLPNPIEQTSEEGEPASKTQASTLSPLNEDYASFVNGKQLFRNNCAQCHDKRMQNDLTGPALHGLLERWEAFPQEDLFQWIRNSKVLINQGHPRAVALWKSWKPTEMTSFPNLSDQEITDLLIFIEKNT